MILIHHIFVLVQWIKAHTGIVKLFTKHLWIISLVLSLLMGGTLASAHGYDHLGDAGQSSSWSSNWLSELLHPEGDDELDCGLSLLGSAQTVASSFFYFQGESHSILLLAPVSASCLRASVRLRPPSRAPPFFS